MTPAFPAALRIETERLIIRRFEKEDGDAFFDIFSDPVTCSDDGDYDAFTVRDEAFDDLMARFALDPTRYAIVLRETGVMIGVLHLMAPLQKRAVPAVEIGYCIHRGFRRQGYAAEAVAALVDALHAQCGYRLVLAGAYAFNHASISLLDKLGFVREGVTRYESNHSVHGLTDTVNFYHEA